MDFAYFAKEINVLPRAGGLLDQDAYHVHLLRSGLQAMAKKEKFDREKQEAEAKGNRRR